MSLNCLTCSQVLQKSESYREYGTENPGLRKVRCMQVERSWSGNIASPSDRQGGGRMAKIKREHRRFHSTESSSYQGSEEPRLVRSPGMRRDWSFENLAEKKNEERVMCR